MLLLMSSSRSTARYPPDCPRRTTLQSLKYKVTSLLSTDPTIVRVTRRRKPTCVTHLTVTKTSYQQISPHEGRIKRRNYRHDRHNSSNQSDKDARIRTPLEQRTVTELAALLAAKLPTNRTPNVNELNRTLAAPLAERRKDLPKSRLRPYLKRR